MHLPDRLYFGQTWQGACFDFSLGRIGGLDHRNKCHPNDPTLTRHLFIRVKEKVSGLTRESIKEQIEGFNIATTKRKRRY
jgi:hypothetical protein